MKRMYPSSGMIMLLTLFIVSACKPALKEGENITINSENAGRYWKAYSTELSGDTIKLITRDAALVSRFRIKNFVLTADLYTTPGAEGAIIFHTGSETGSPAKGYSVTINNSDYRSGSAQKTGGLSMIRNNYVRMVPDEKWFRLKIEVRNNLVQVTVDDKLISEYIQPEQPVRIAGLEGMTLTEGFIRLHKTTDNGTILLGDISIESYPDELPAMSDSAFVNDSTGEMLTLLNQQNFPVIDFHGHLKGGLTVDQVCEHGRLQGYNFGLAPNCGLNFPVTNDSSLLAYYREMAPEPVFKAMQCEGREWITLFSPDAIAKYDYIFTDAMTWTDHKGRRMRLWIPEETFVDNEQLFMDMLVTRIESIISKEPIDIHVNPTFLPDQIAADYDRLWTPERMDRVIKVLVDYDVALEINSRFRIPSIAFVKRAKEAGVKFTLGTNNGGNEDLGRLEYSLQVIKEAGLTPEDMFLPAPSGNKKVITKGLPAKVTG